jgi:NhaP-type Na+/H+ or K+/H+ antiporter
VYQEADAAFWLRFAALQLVLGPLTGIAGGWLGGKACAVATKAGWMSHVFLQLSAVALALIAFGTAELIGRNGFIAAFVGGMTLGNAHRHLCECIYEFAEAEGQLLTLLIFMIFGAVMVTEALPHVDGTMVLYAVLSLTVIRMLPVALSLLGSGARVPRCCSSAGSVRAGWPRSCSPCWCSRRPCSRPTRRS